MMNSCDKATSSLAQRAPQCALGRYRVFRTACTAGQSRLSFLSRQLRKGFSSPLSHHRLDS